MRLYLLRHGESEGNKLGVTQGHADYKLTKKGVEQVEKVSKFLSGMKIDKIYSSDLRRCAETTNIIRKKHQNASVVFTEILREQNKRQFEGRPKHEMSEAAKRAGVPYDLFLPKGGESLIEVYPRVAQLFDDILFDDYENVLIVSHGIPIGCLLVHILKKPFSLQREFVPKSCTALSIIEIGGKRRDPLLVNALPHFC
jgi:broad specificity phosphatase PhoE